MDVGRNNNINKVSICIPMYNAEKYIGRCIESLLCQDYENIEIIIVNDGSTDKSLEIVKSYRDSRIVVFSTDNSGPSHARNIAIQNSTGDYVCFVDSDDYVLPSYVSSLLNSVQISKIGFVFSGVSYYSKGSIRWNNKYGCCMVKKCSDQDIVRIPFKHICSAIYDKNILNECFFDDGCRLVYEDFLFGASLIKKHDGIFACDDKANYVYCDNGDSSITRLESYSPKDSIRARDAVYAHCKLSAFFDDFSIKRYLIEKGIHLLVAYDTNIRKYKGRMDRQVLKECKILLSPNIKFLSLKYRLMINAYFLFPWLLALLPKRYNKYK